MGTTKITALAAAALLALGSTAQAAVIVSVEQAADAADISGQPVAWDAGSQSHRVVLPDGAPFNYLQVRLSGSAQGAVNVAISLAGMDDITRSFAFSGGPHIVTVHTTDDEALDALQISSDVVLENVDLITIAGYAGEGGSAQVPEPAIAGLLGAGLLALGLRRRARRRPARAGDQSMLGQLVTAFQPLR